MKPNTTRKVPAAAPFAFLCLTCGACRNKILSAIFGIPMIKLGIPRRSRMEDTSANDRSSYNASVRRSTPEPDGWESWKTWKQGEPTPQAHRFSSQAPGFLGKRVAAEAGD